MAKASQKADGEPTEYFGLVEDIIVADPAISSYARSFLLLDCVKAAPFRRNAAESLLDRSSLALVRAMSTPRRWSERFGLGGLNPGDWVAFTLDDKGRAPRAWELPAEAGYAASPPRSVRSMRRLGNGLASPHGNPDADLAVQLVSASAWASGGRQIVDTSALANFLNGAATEAVEIIALDVGQASANLIKRGGRAIGLFDAGAPLWFNKGSLKLDFRPPSISTGFVFLSHWDFDHFDLARRKYMHLQWFAPLQPVGPNAAKLQAELGANLTFVDGALSHQGFSIARGTSPDPRDRNGTGFQLRYDAPGTAVLLTGDANYSSIDPPMYANLNRVAIPHHGGIGTPPPAPAGSNPVAVASYGLPNRYHHPAAATISGHRQLGWDVRSTAESGGISRGDRPLVP